MTERFETPQELLAGAIIGFGIAEGLYQRGDLVSQLYAVRIAYGSADMFELGAGELIVNSMNLGEATAEDEERIRKMSHEDVLQAEPEAVLAINGLVDTLGPFSRAVLNYARAETIRRYGLER